MGGQRYETLDGMRGVAAFAVLLYHSVLVSKVQLLPGGFFSVDLFFVLSGFVIAFSYERRLRDGLSLSGFIGARARRLLPTHFWAFGIVLSVTLAAFASGDTRAGVTLSALLIAGLLNAMLIPDPLTDAVTQSCGGCGYAFPINTMLWSLFDEWIVNTIYAAAIFGMRLRAVAAVGAVSGAFATWFALRLSGWRFGDQQMTLLPGLFPALALFTAGVLIYRAHRRGLLTALPSVPPWCIYAGWLLICATPQVASNFVAGSVVAIIIAPLTVILLVRAERQVGPIFRWLGAASYPLYVSHLAALMVAAMLVAHFRLAPGALSAIPAVVLALALAEIVRRLAESRIAPVLARFRTVKETA